MKTTIAIFCILGIGATIIFTNVKNKTKELIETTNRLMIESKKSTFQHIEDHNTHNDIIISDGNILCEKTQSIYRIK